MKNHKALLFLAIIALSLVITLSSSERENDEFAHDQSRSRFLRDKYEKARYYQTCDKSPRICRLKGSPGPDCCKKKCVDVMNDKQNCGFCGKRCKYNEMCCKGKCVNTFVDKKNCGGCHNKCKKGSVCVYGMCSYA